MTNKFDKQEFMRNLEQNGWLSAIEYKDRFVPKTFYKYFPLFDERFVKYEEENEKRYSSLEENKIWVSSYSQLNDPFEYKMFTIDKERLEVSGYKIEDIEFFFENIRKNILTTCFSGETENNMPLWAHYANNHTGYCVKYRVNNQKPYYPVFYEPRRVKTAVIPTNIFSELMSASANKIQVPSENFYKYVTYFNISLCCKHKLWEYENEYRLLYPTINTSNGTLVSLNDIGLEIDSIFVGYKTNDENRQRLISIAKKLNCNIYELYFDEYSEEFKLQSKKIFSE